jgi:hypothetical protein
MVRGVWTVLREDVGNFDGCLQPSAHGVLFNPKLNMDR